mmetsp:Transcript_12870/g.30592  ORF Transcript_12870/g.30592 Transcript_12870/m.30592 type:complete len:265 (+) Transcript_12870:831-1625(+)
MIVSCMKPTCLPLGHESDDRVVVRRSRSKGREPALLHLWHLDQLLQLPVRIVAVPANLLVSVELPLGFFREPQQGDHHEEVVIVLPHHRHQLLLQLDGVLHGQRMQLVLHRQTQNRGALHPRAVHPAHLHVGLAVGQEHVHRPGRPLKVALLDLPRTPVDDASESCLLRQVRHLACHGGFPLQAAAEQVQLQVPQHRVEALQIHRLAADGFPELLELVAVLEVPKALLLQSLEQLGPCHGRLLHGIQRGAPLACERRRRVRHHV